MNARPDLSALSETQKDALIEELMAMVQKLNSRVEELEGRLRKDSHNSSKPPSSDGLRKKSQSLRQRSGRKPGGQSGSTLKRVTHPDVVVEHPLAPHCNRCGAALEAQAEGLITVRRQVFDLLKPVLQVTEHRGYELHCRCGQHHCSRFPEEVVAPVQYGPVVKSTLVYLTQSQLLPMQRTVQLITDLYGLELSVGTVQASIGQAAQRLAPAYERIAQAVSAAPVVHFDETGQRVSARLRWLHAAATTELTWYGAHDKRGRIAMDAAGILPAFNGVAVHDGWASYREYACTHALCNAHHLRELIYLEETTQQRWTRKMIEFLRAAQKEADAAKRANRAVNHKRLTRLRRRYRAILSEGERHNPLV